MKKRIVLALLLSVVLCLIVGVSGCSGSNKEDGQLESSISLCENTSFEKGFFTIMTPANCGESFSSVYYINNFYETLVTLVDGEIKPGLAEKWDVSEDGKTYTFYLKKDVKFSDESDLNAEVVKMNFDAIPGILGNFNGSFGMTSTLIESTEAIDENTFVLKLKSPYYGVLKEMTMVRPYGIMGARAYTEEKTLSDVLKNETIGTGPYMYTGDNDGNVYNFIANPNYYGEKPDVSSFKINIIMDPDAAVLALTKGEIDMLSGNNRLSSNAFVEFNDNKNIETENSLNVIENTQYIAFNSEKEPFENENVRKAVALAIDKETLCSQVHNNLVTPTSRLFPKNYPNCDVKIAEQKYNVDEAKKLLDEAGYSDTDGDGIREKDGQKLEVQFPYSTANGIDMDGVLLIKNQLEEIGMQVIPANLEMMSWFEKTMQGDWNMTISHTLGSDYDPDSQVLNMDINKKSDPCAWQVSLVLDNGSALIEELETCNDDQRVEEIYNEILTGISDHTIMVPLFTQNAIAAYNPVKIDSILFDNSAVYVDISNVKMK